MRSISFTNDVILKLVLVLHVVQFNCQLVQFLYISLFKWDVSTLCNVTILALKGPQSIGRGRIRSYEKPLHEGMVQSDGKTSSIPINYI